MSVINQMLKDLEQRAPESGKAGVVAVSHQKPSTLKIVLLTIIILLSVNALGLYIWNLQKQVENNNEKSKNAQLLVSQKITTQSAQEQDVAMSAPQKKSVNLQKAKTEKTIEKQVTKPAVKLSTESLSQPSSKPEVESTPEQVAYQQNHEQSVATVTAQPQGDISEVVDEKIVSTLKTKTVKPETTTKMSVSRRQLTSKELVAQKIAKAEKALNLNQITKAEQLYEEVLIIEPENKQARKKLAALWFGRKSYQQALNLLSQGIAIDNQDGEMRLLKARIHLSQGQNEAVYNTLKSLPDFEHEEYQVMLANIAQQIEQYSSAISAYQVLIKMQPYSGRWHLGLAIIYDKTSQFPLASKEYAAALTKTDLSASSAKFATQRMQALGE